MAQAEVQAAWQAEFKRIDATEAPDGPGAAFRWSGDEAEARRLQEEHSHHYLRWTFVGAFARYDRWPYRRGPIVFGLTRPGPHPSVLKAPGGASHLTFDTMIFSASSCQALAHALTEGRGRPAAHRQELSWRL